METDLPLTGLRILVVDDNDDSCCYITAVLELEGASVKAVPSAALALEILPHFNPDALICDIAMPGEDGYTFIRKVRLLSANEGGQVPAVALTAYADSEDRVHALEAGFQRHIAKPVEPSELVEIIANLVTFSKC
ncbi:response regulator [Anabaena sphaerica FACHB-251]|uniref:Response regulator n=1 Tax=Anabaena sphaerica FACHB-251 TaxID=2692883 RepID=A0A926WFY7_9NOST|nr:response regulator [Anabaena sphaerica]MBD2292423.1 response regulator [Anabaena sphaerica FACHB-251]